MEARSRCLTALGFPHRKATMSTAVRSATVTGIAMIVAAFALTGCLDMSADPHSPPDTTPNSSTTPSDAGSELTITVHDGQGGVRTWTLHCNPPGGTHPSPGAACQALARSAAALQPVPGDQVCAQIYGGPQTAEITGTWDGKPVHSRLSRINGCEIERWNRLRAVLDG